MGKRRGGLTVYTFIYWLHVCLEMLPSNIGFCPCATGLQINHRNGLCAIGGRLTCALREKPAVPQLHAVLTTLYLLGRRRRHNSWNRNIPKPWPLTVFKHLSIYHGVLYLDPNSIKRLHTLIHIIFWGFYRVLRIWIFFIHIHSLLSGETSTCKW